MPSNDPMQEVPPAVRPERRGQRAALGVLTAVAFVLVAWMAAPLLVGLALGTVMGFTAQPFHARLVARLHQRGSLASAITTLLGGLLMAGGGAVALWIVARELIATVQIIEHDWLGSSVAVGPRTARVLDALGVPREEAVARFREQLGRLADLIAQGAALLVQASAGVLLTIVVSLWTMFYVLVDWPSIAHHLERLLPLDPGHTRALVAEFRIVGRRAFVGTVASAAAQGTLAGIGFALVGLPEPMTWAVLLCLTSFIPVVGTLLVWVPAAIWLLTVGHPVRALLLAAWSLVFVMALNDYVVRPRLIGRGSETHPLLTLVALIGGISVFGVAGLIVGPVIMSLFVASARIYEREREREQDA